MTVAAELVLMDPTSSRPGSRSPARSCSTCASSWPPASWTTRPASRTSAGTSPGSSPCCASGRSRKPRAATRPRPRAGRPPGWRRPGRPKSRRMPTSRRRSMTSRRRRPDGRDERNRAGGGRADRVGHGETTEGADTPATATSTTPTTGPSTAPAPAAEPAGPRPNRRKVREGIVVSDAMQATIVVAVIERVRHPRYGKTVQRTKRLYVHDAEAPPRSATGSGSSRPGRCPSSSAGAWPRSWSVPDDPAGVAPPGGRQLRRPRGAVHPRARWLAPALRQHRRRLRRHGQGRHPRRGGEEGRRRQVRRRPHQEGEAPSRRQLHPLRRERGRAHQRPAAAPRAPASSARSAASCGTRSSCASSRWPRRCCDADPQGRPGDRPLRQVQGPPRPRSSGPSRPRTRSSSRA